MSADLWGWSLASADDYLTENECSMLLENGLISDSDEDLLKTFSGAAPKIETGKFFHDDSSITMYPPSPPEIKPSPAELANDLLQQLEIPYKRENIYSNWLEGKEELTIFENIAQVPDRVEVSQVALPASTIYPPPQTAPRPTEELLREFETVYDAVELTHLTPPQSPPGPATQLLLTYAQHAQCAPLVPLSSLQIVPPDQWTAAAATTSTSISSPTLTEYDCDSQSLEELIRHRAAQLASPQPERSSSPSPHSSPSSSPRSSSTDDDWCVSSRPKPYSRNVDDRRSRKKEQNKNAATRYRQKKKAEIEVLLNEEQALRKRHTDLGEKCSDLQREIRYIKGLMRDLFKAKGLIK